MTHLAEDLASAQIFLVDDDHAIDGFAVVYMVDEVTLSQIDG